MKKITVLIPCLNEANAISNVIKRLPRKRLSQAGYMLEIIVIDNNSIDDTATLARTARATVIHEPKRGKGNALRAGFYAISNDTDYVVMLDGDATYRPEEILRLVEPLDSGFCSVIVGSRLHGQIHEGSMKRLNHLGNRLYARLVRLAYKVKVTDVLSGYFAWTREAVEMLRTEIDSPGFAVEMEMITKLARMGYKIYSIPISYEPRIGQSNLKPLRDGYYILRIYLSNLNWKPTPVLAAENKALAKSRLKKILTTNLLEFSRFKKEENEHETA